MTPLWPDVTSDTHEVGCWWDRSQALRCCGWSAGPLLIGLDSKDSWERCLTCCLEMWREKVPLWRLLLLHLYYCCFLETLRSPVTHNESLIRLFQRKAENRNIFLLEKFVLMFQNSWSLSTNKRLPKFTAVSNLISVSYVKKSWSCKLRSSICTRPLVCICLEVTWDWLNPW